jgi:hypothetical protein
MVYLLKLLKNEIVEKLLALAVAQGYATIGHSHNWATKILLPNFRDEKFSGEKICDFTEGRFSEACHLSRQLQSNS